jgi:hypothetical protein
MTAPGLRPASAKRWFVLRILGAALVLMLTAVAALTSFGPLPAAGDGAAASFVPVIAPTGSPTPVQTALPNPISRPPDARGVTETTAPFASPTAFSPPPAPPSLWLSTSGSFTVPCELHGDRIFISVVVDGRPAAFLLDSGAPYSSIDPAAARSRDAPITLHTLQIGELRFNSLTAGVSRIAAGSSAYLGDQADGVLGQELFSRYPVRIDYRICSVTVFRDAQAAAGGSPSPTAQLVPIQMIKGVPEVSVRLDGAAPGMAVLDTASDANADVTVDFVMANGLTVSSSLPELRRWLPGGELSGETARVASMAVGSSSVDHPVIGIVTSGAREAVGYVGNGFLQNFSVLFDEPAAQLILDPVAGAKSASYDRSGAWLVVRGGAITVKSVLAGSPAAKTPLSPGDRILAAGGTGASDLDSVRALLAGAPGTTVAIVYDHGGKRHSGVIVLKTLL